jgi:two-component system chemotaxis response regulator CheY
VKSLIVEDDYVSRNFLQGLVKNYGPCDIAVNGDEAIEAMERAVESNEHYDVIFLDIMMPGIDGQETLMNMRGIEKEHGIAGTDCAKVIMTTSLDDPQVVMDSFKLQCDSYIVKPVKKDKLAKELQTLGLIEKE